MSLTVFIDQLDALISRGMLLSELKPHIMSLREHAEAVEAEHAKLILDYAALESHHAKLKQAHMQLKSEVAQGEIDAIKVKVLQVLADGQNMKASAVAHSLKCSEAVAEMHLAELQGKEMAYFDEPYIGHSSWKITPAGTRYLFSRRLIE